MCGACNVGVVTLLDIGIAKKERAKRDPVKGCVGANRQAINERRAISKKRKK